MTDRSRKYCRDDGTGWSKEVWDLAPIGWLIDPEWAPSVRVPSPVLTDAATWSVDRSRHPMRYFTQLHRNAIFGDLFRKLESCTTSDRNQAVYMSVADEKPLTPKSAIAAKNWPENG